MRHVTRLCASSLLAALILFVSAGCAGPSSAAHTSAPTATPTPKTPAGLLVFGTSGKRIFGQAGSVTPQYTSTLYDLDPQTGAVLWHSPAYTGQATGAPIIVGTHAIYAIGANVTWGQSTQSGTVDIYAADLASGNITHLDTIGQIYNPNGFGYQLRLTRLNAATTLLSYMTPLGGNSASSTLLAFTSDPGAPVWRASIPDQTAISYTSVADSTISAMAYHFASKSLSLMQFNGNTGALLHDTALPGIQSTWSATVTNGLLVFNGSPSLTSRSGNMYAYSLNMGSKVWEQPLANSSIQFYGVANGLILRSGHPTSTNMAGDTLVAIHASDGSPAWSARDGFVEGMDGDASHVYVAISNQVTDTSWVAETASLSSATGATVWLRKWPSSVQGALGPVVYENSVYVATVSTDANGNPTLPSTVYALSTADGSVQWSQKIAGEAQFPVETNHP